MLGTGGEIHAFPKNEKAPVVLQSAVFIHVYVLYVYIGSFPG